MVPVHMSHHHLPLSCSSAMTLLGLEPRIVFLPTSQLEYLQNSAVLDKKRFEFSTFEHNFVLKIHSQAPDYATTTKFRKKPILQFWRQPKTKFKVGTQIHWCTENQDRHKMLPQTSQL
jgi:hypothetical protein